jgi:AraC-like DNA-binding protein
MISYKKALNFIQWKHKESDLSVEVLASKVYLSRSQLYRKLKTFNGVSVNEFIRNAMIKSKKEMGFN